MAKYDMEQHIRRVKLFTAMFSRRFKTCKHPEVAFRWGHDRYNEMDWLLSNMLGEVK